MGIMETYFYLVLMLIGLLAGGVGGLLGVGGSIVMIPALTEFGGPNQHLYQATAMIVNFFVVVPAVIRHHRARVIDWRSVRRLLPPAIGAVVIGVGASEMAFFAGTGERYLQAGFGLFLLVAATLDLFRLFRPHQDANPSALPGKKTDSLSWRFALAIAIPTGLIAGLFGVGGGLVAVPLQRRLLGVPIRQAIANSAAVIIATSFAGSITKNYAYLSTHEGSYAPLYMAGVLIPTAMLGSWIGAYGTHRIPVRGVRIAFLGLLLVAAIRIIHGAYQSFPAL